MGSNIIANINNYFAKITLQQSQISVHIQTISHGRFHIHNNKYKLKNPSQMNNLILTITNISSNIMITIQLSPIQQSFNSTQ